MRKRFNKKEIEFFSEHHRKLDQKNANFRRNWEYRTKKWIVPPIISSIAKDSFDIWNQREAAHDDRGRAKWKLIISALWNNLMNIRLLENIGIYDCRGFCILLNFSSRFYRPIQPIAVENDLWKISITQMFILLNVKKKSAMILSLELSMTFQFHLLLFN